MPQPKPVRLYPTALQSFWLVGGRTPLVEPYSPGDHRHDCTIQSSVA
ncbi:hypothetical protein [Synechocystis sp. PCC 6714]|nr:hypothetical protein [Synechocystis sp. PCC 6714]